jgi:release factor glutamine methyltransferase
VPDAAGAAAAPVAAASVAAAAVSAESVAVSVPAASASVGDAVRDSTATLAAAGCETPRLDAEVLLASVLGVDRARLVIDRDAELDGAPARSFAEAVWRRAAREPVAYITGVREFRRLALRVDSRVLIPRPETELLVDVGLTLPAGARVVDVGCGSGAVALAVKDERRDLSVVGVDSSPDAIEVASCNAARLGLDVEFVVGDLLGGRGDCDAVLANLPYVGDGASLAPEIALYEPAAALYAGVDGLDVIRRLVAAVASVPVVALEVGFDQADVVASLLGAAGVRSIERLRDLAGHERVVVGRRA